jgi:hypothetical protein
MMTPEMKALIERIAKKYSIQTILEEIGKVQGFEVEYESEPEYVIILNYEKDNN